MLADQVSVSVAVQGADILGEVPLWCERTKKIWWIDLRRPALQSYDPATGKHSAQRMPADMVIGAIAMRKEGGFLLATNTGFYFFNPDDGMPPEPLINPEAHLPGMRLNDGKCDRRGRFWCGSMLDGKREPVGTLYKLNTDLTCEAMHGGIVVPNSVAWSLDDKTMYLADTHNQVIWSFDYDLDDGAISNKRVFKDWTHQLGRPDGSTVDSEGFLWNCMVAVGQVVRLAPDGRVDRVIQLPISNATCPAFGGEDLRTLYVTSNSQRLTAAQLAREPLAGSLFAIDVGVAGVAEPRFGH
ncbi:MAG: SMP-30/gluconolactonase/LRE family protein [Pseudomonadota bacterium]